MLQQLVDLPIPKVLELGKLYYIVNQRAPKTSWIYKGHHPNGHWLRNRGTGADFYVKLEQVREIPVTDYNVIKSTVNGYPQPGEIELVDKLALFYEKTGTRVSQKHIVDNIITMEEIDAVLQDKPKVEVSKAYYNSTPEVVKKPAPQDFTIPTPITFEEDKRDTPDISLEDAKAIVAAMPNMAEKMYLLYPELKPVVPAIWDLIVTEGYVIDPVTLVTKTLTPRGKMHAASTTDDFLGMQEFIYTIDAVRRMSLLQKFLPKLDSEKELYHIVCSPETGAVEVVATADVSSPFTFNDESLAEEFLANNISTLEKYFEFITVIFK